MKKILYVLTEPEMDNHYQDFKHNFFHLYSQLQKHFDLLWKQRQLWALSFRLMLLIRGNNTNNYIECSFSILKNIIFSRTQAFNPVQVFHFVTDNIDHFYKFKLLRIAYKHLDHTITKRFFCPDWEKVNSNSI